MTASTVEPAARFRPWLLRFLWIAFTTALIIAVASLPWRDIVRQLSNVELLWVTAAMAANFVILPLWAAEWRILVPASFQVTYARMFEIVTITASVLNAVPFFAGEASAVGLLIGRAGLSRVAALSVLALDQLLVAFAKLVMLGAAAYLVALPDWLRAGVLTLVVAFSALLATLVALAHGWVRSRSPVDTGSGRLSLATRLRTWGRHLDMLRETRRAAPAAAIALLKKGAEFAAILATQLAFGLEPSLTAAVLVVASLSITTLLPIAPANLGVYEATVFGAYRYLGIPADVALGLALVQHACFLLPSVATGYVLATLAQVRRGAASAGS